MPNAASDTGPAPRSNGSWQTAACLRETLSLAADGPTWNQHYRATQDLWDDRQYRIEVDDVIGPEMYLESKTALPGES